MHSLGHIQTKAEQTKAEQTKAEHFFGKLMGNTTPIFFHCGGVGSQLGSLLWQQLLSGDSKDDESFMSSISLTDEKGSHVPPALFFDMDSSGSDLAREQSNLMKTTSCLPSQFVWDHYDISDGLLSTTAKVSELFHDPIRCLLERVDKADLVVLTHSAFGGARSCLSYSIPELLLDEHNVKMPVLLFSVVNTMDSDTQGVFYQDLKSSQFQLSPLQRYIQCHNIAAQHINRVSDCTVLMDCDWIAGDETAMSQQTNAIADLLRPSGTDCFNLSLSEFSCFDANNTSLDTTSRWNVSSILLFCFLLWLFHENSIFSNDAINQHRHSQCRH
jgi:hypothetical protein